MTWLFDHEKESLVHTGCNYFKYAESNKGWTPTYIGSLSISRMPLGKGAYRVIFVE